MKAYVDASVLLRVILGAPDSLPEWPSINAMESSALIEVECRRTFERLRLVEGVEFRVLASHRRALQEVIEHMTLANVSESILQRAGEPFSVSLKTLDAIHLATAIASRELRGPLTFATHDHQLARAAREAGFEVLGV